MEKIFFQKLKEGRKDYFVEYLPPHHGDRFAILQLTYPKRVELLIVAEDMEREAIHWGSRFPIPVLVSSFDETGSLIYLDGVRATNHLMAFCGSANGKFERHWKSLKNDEMPGYALNHNNLLKVFADVPHKTESQVRSQVISKARRLRVGWAVVVGWIALAPIALLVAEYFGPLWLGAVLFLYGLWKAAIHALKLFGKYNWSASELEERERVRRMEHYSYHCELNPKGFERLKCENFECDQNAKVKREAAALIGDEKDRQ